MGESDVEAQYLVQHRIELWSNKEWWNWMDFWIGGTVRSIAGSISPSDSSRGHFANDKRWYSESTAADVLLNLNLITYICRCHLGIWYQYLDSFEWKKAAFITSDREAVTFAFLRRDSTSNYMSLLLNGETVGGFMVTRHAIGLQCVYWAQRSEREQVTTWKYLKSYYENNTVSTLYVNYPMTTQWCRHFKFCE